LTTLDRLRAVIAATTGAGDDEITEDTTLASVTTDSLEAVNLLLEIEIEFDIDMGEARAFRTVRDVLAAIEGR
jgi:acyl carrier protein